MRFLAAIAFLLLGVAYAHHSVEHQLRYPQFHEGLAHYYDVTINMTAGVPGLSPQVSKSVIHGEAIIYAKTPQELILKFRSVEVSGSLPSVGSKTEELSLSEDSSLEQELQVPTYAKYENGKVIEYSYPTKETLVAQKIRRTVWRNLEVYLDERFTGSNTEQEWPITYNLTRDSPAGKYKSHYAVTVSPYIDFPEFLDVYNITRYDNFEDIPYIAYKSHHNYDKQGCPEVCKKEHIENRFGSGCPTGQEPHHGLIKRSFVQHHNLRLSKRHGSNILIFDSVYTKETHLADLYDQDLDTTVESTFKFYKAVRESIPEAGSNQVIKSDLDDLTEEVQEEVWEDHCNYPDSKTTINEAIRLLNEVADIVLEDDAKSEKSKEVGHKIVTIQKYMQRFQHGDFRTFKQSIKSYDKLAGASEKDKIKRQLWLDILPTVGTSESVSFIVTHIMENINLDVRGISFWESKSVLEALPQNIHHPSEKTINELSRLLEVLKDQKTTGYTMFYSAAHMAVARVIRRLCAYPLPRQEENIQSASQEKHSLRSLWRSQPQPMRQSGSDKFELYLTCPESTANAFIEKVTNLLLNTRNKAKRVIYIETLSLTGLPQVLPTLRKYVHGDPHHDPLFSGLTHSYVDYLKTSTIFTLHNLVGRSPRQVQDMLIPVFFNVTQPPKVRNSAFSVIVKSHPSLALLEEVAALSWREPSEEVASYVTSTFESFGNSSLPCYQDLSHRFKKVYPQLKRYDGGVFKAKNILLDVWDELTGYGIEKRYDFIPSNESFIPSVVYASVGYNLGNLKDYVYQVAANVQGISSHHVFDEVFRRLGLGVAGDIPKNSEDKLFKDMDIVARDPEPWKAILYQKFFYSTSYYYFDGEATSGKDLSDMVMELFTHYIKKEGEVYSGHLVKLYIPTAFHTKSIFKTVPFPVHFEMKSPLLFSLKFSIDKTVAEASEVRALKVHVQPSLYHTHIYTNEILNLGDCKRVGAYYEQKTVFSYPFISAIHFADGAFKFSYELPKLPKTVVTHRSESGTYAGKNYQEPLPSTQDRRTIKTNPYQFKYPLSFSHYGLPRFSGEVKTEDLQFGMDPLPRNWQETALYIQRLYLNAGWRRRSIEIQRIPDFVQARPTDAIEYYVHYWRDHISRGHSESDWSKDLKFDDKLSQKDTTSYAAEGRKIYHKFTHSLSHIKDSVDVYVLHRDGSRVLKRSAFTLEYYHTYGGYLHLIHLNSTTSGSPKPFEITADYAVGFTNMPNGFKYNQNYGQQKGLAIGGVSFCKSTPFLNPSIAAKAVFQYKPLHEVLPLDQFADSKLFEPDTHEECIKDTAYGNAHSPACIKAIREKSIYNNLRMQAVWSNETPEYITEFAKNVDMAMKHAYFPHVQVAKASYGHGRESNSLHVEATYIDKWTDEPVVDIHVEKPTETVNYTMISAGHLRPLSSIESAHESYAHAYTNNSYPATCSLTGNYVRTYDMKVYQMPDPSCTYVLSTHCTNYKKFAIFAKHDSSKVTEIQIHFGNDKIVLRPGSGSSYTVKYNSQDYTLNTLEHAMLNRSANISAQVFQTSDGNSHVKIHAGNAGIKVYYDGAYVYVQVSPRYKGELCGLCSEYNGEVAREFRGVDRCLYLTAKDFARSSIVGRCGGKQEKGRAICDNEEITAHWAGRRGQSEEEDDEGYDPISKRNVVTSKGSKLCFSTKPLPVCENSAEPKMTEPRQVDFHCLPKQDVHARKMVTESKRRILGELETKAVDYSETIEVAKKC